MECGHCGYEKTAEGFCKCPTVRPLPPQRTAIEPLDLETVDEDGPEPESFWLGEEELPF
jgi:hypothetical protein